jgi:hypothetical protein
MATYIPGKSELQDDDRPTWFEMIGIIGTIVCTGLSAAIMVWRLLQ